MKQFIVLSAVLPLLLIMIMILFSVIANYQLISAVNDIVYEAKEEAILNGGFDIEKLRNMLSLQTGIDNNKIHIDAPETGSVERINMDGTRGIIKYRVEVPVNIPLFIGNYFGSARKNYVYVIDSVSPSEYLR